MFHQSIDRIVQARKAVTVPPDMSVREACRHLVTAAEGAVAVMDGAELVGMLEDRDVIARAICADRDTAATRVADIMTQRPHRIAVTASLAEAMQVMGETGQHHLPVMEGAQLLGIISMRDIPTQYRLLVERAGEFVEEDAEQYGQLTLLM